VGRKTFAEKEKKKGRTLSKTGRWERPVAGSDRSLDSDARKLKACDAPSRERIDVIILCFHLLTFTSMLHASP
jgi:hypothetical protein